MHIRRLFLPVILAQPIASSFVEGSITYASISEETASVPATCPLRTINYITQTLPQLCLTSAWTSPAASSSEVPEASSSDESQRSALPSNSQDATTYNATGCQAATESNVDSEEIPVEPASTPFMSFEDWKEMMLRRTGQDPRDLRQRQATPQGPNDRTPPESVHAGLGEEDEISLNFDGYLGDVEEHKEASADSVANPNHSNGAEEAVTFEDGRPSIHRSKDAGKTCKERFSYSSFDAGATVLKTSPGAKNAKAILVENKDSYMLLECSAKNKFVIIELSDDILIDTVVLANFEFFSSMIRHFRVSVSDRYPVKIERWKELGLFEARNSRDMQPFLVENPQIWAKYVRVEFLTHYGNEYYCPVSLVRVHGSRMLESWKDGEGGGRDDEGLIEDHAEHVHIGILEENPHILTEKVEPEHPTTFRPSSSSSLQCTVDLRLDQLRFIASTCEAFPRSTQEAIASYTQDVITDNYGPIQNESYVTMDGETPHSHVGRHAQTELSQSEDIGTPTASVSLNDTSTATTIPNANGNTQTNSSIETPNVSSRSSTNISTASNSKVPSQHTSVGKNRTSATTSASAASPTIQESFFKTITKRLQQVETNLTLSLKYVEDHARHVQDMLQKTENKQTSKIAVFLDTLNQTVLAELHNVREQYDEIWQSTVIALESQREQSGREIIALSTRLNLLADEVIFQKRMAIVQATLLLSCLLLVIFSRGVSIPSLVPLVEQPDENIFGGRKPSALQPHVSYQTETNADTNLETVFEGRGEVDYVPITRMSPGAGENRNLSGSPECSGQSKATMRHYQRLSPPLTPSNLDQLTESNDVVLAYDPKSNPFRAPLSQQQTTARKPLPALPENPSSP